MVSVSNHLLHRGLLQVLSLPGLPVRLLQGLVTVGAAYFEQAGSRNTNPMKAIVRYSTRATENLGSLSYGKLGRL